MNPNAQMRWNEDFDEPWRRLPWVVLAALLSWVVLLGGFAQMLAQKAPPEPPPTTIEARIIELPPPSAGLQGGGRPAGAPVHAPRNRTRPFPRPYPSRSKRRSQSRFTMSEERGQTAAGDNGAALALRHRQAR